MKLASWEPTDSTIVGQQTARRLSQNTQKRLWGFYETSDILKVLKKEKEKRKCVTIFPIFTDLDFIFPKKELFICSN